VRALICIALFATHGSLAGIVRKEDFTMGVGLSSSSVYHSNINLNSSEESDMVFSLQPRLEISKPQGAIRGSVGLGGNLVRYLNTEENNSEGLVILGGIEMGEVFGEGSPIQIRTEMEQSSDADGFTGTVPRRETYGIQAEGRHRFGFGGGVAGAYGYRLQRSLTEGFSDVESRRWQFKGFYQRAAESIIFDLALEQERAESQGSEDDIESVTTILSTGVSGPLVSTVKGTLRVGAQEREFEGGDLEPQSGPYFSASLDWSYSSLMSFSLRGEQRFVTDSSDRSRDEMNLQLELRRDLGGAWSATGAVRYLESRSQEPDELSETNHLHGVAVGIDYSLAEWGTARWSFEWDDARSSSERFNYQAIRVGFTFSARF
jgi:hypothetical protein